MKKNSILDYYARRGLAFLHGGENATDQLIHCMQLRGNEKNIRNWLWNRSNAHQAASFIPGSFIIWY